MERSEVEWSNEESGREYKRRGRKFRTGEARRNGWSEGKVGRAIWRALLLLRPGPSEEGTSVRV